MNLCTVRAVSSRWPLHLVVPTIVLAATVGSAGPASAAAGQQRLVGPIAAELARAGAAIPDATLSTTGARSLAASASWGGTFTASTGEQVHIQVSDSYPQDPAVAQRWANFLASLVHGSELSTVQVYLAPLQEVQRFCGRDALACYNPASRQLVAPGDDLGVDLSAEAVVTHEYGHHVAASRSDAPWPAVAYGTKRWATYEQICARTRAGQLFPGAEDAVHYELNPGEAFAETYRVLNERRLGVAESPWDIVTRSLYPDQTALELLQQDVLSPWTQNTTSTTTVALSRRARVKTVSFATPLDGTVRVTARAARGERLRVQLLSASGTATSTALVPAGSTRSVSGTACGMRSVRVRVTLTRGSGRVTLTSSRP